MPLCNRISVFALINLKPIGNPYMKVDFNCGQGKYLTDAYLCYHNYNRYYFMTFFEYLRFITISTMVLFDQSEFLRFY